MDKCNICGVATGISKLNEALDAIETIEKSLSAARQRELELLAVIEEYKQRAEAAEAKLKELKVIESMFDDALQQDDCFWLRELASKAQIQLSMLCAKPFPSPKQEEK